MLSVRSGNEVVIWNHLITIQQKTILSEEIFIEIFSQEDEIQKARMILSAEERADELKVGRQFKQLLKAYKKVAEEKPRKQGNTER